MNLNQAQRFASKVSGEPIRIVLGDSHKKWEACSLIDWEMFVFDRTWWRVLRKNPRHVKATILHEVGHRKAKKPYADSRPAGEYRAQVWAIRKAKELELGEVVKLLRQEIRAWKNFKWRSPYRRYRIASKMFTEKPV